MCPKLSKFQNIVKNYMREKNNEIESQIGQVYHKIYPPLAISA